MKITIVDKMNSKKPKDVKLKDGMLFIHVSDREAISIAQSLLTQIKNNDANSGRVEHYDENGTYFSIGVTR